MNYTRMLQLADEIETPTLLKSVKFAMRDFIRSESLPTPSTESASSERFTGKLEHYTTCDTVCCIGGHAVLMFGKEGNWFGGTDARELLDLTIEQAEQLFYNQGGYISHTKFTGITRKEAAKAIRRMVEEDIYAQCAAATNTK